MVARTKLQPVPPPRDETVVVMLTHDAHELARRMASPCDGAAKAAIMLICAREGGLVAGDRLRVVLADDVDGAQLPPPRVKRG